MALIYGTEGDDVGRTKLVGTAFADRIYARGGNDEVDGGGGNDQIYGMTGDDFLFGGGGDDEVDGGTGKNSLFGGLGADRLFGGPGTDHFDGGDGIDEANYTKSSAFVTVSLASNVGMGEALGDTYASIERLVGSVFGDTLGGSQFKDWLRGNGGNDHLNGLLGNDNLYGETGNDTITGGGGNDLIDGGTGIDTAVYSDSTAAVAVDLATGTGTGGTAQGDRFIDVENVIGTPYGDVFIGDAGANSFDGGFGNDVFQGGAGADHLNGGTGTDTASYASADRGFEVDLAEGKAWSSHADIDLLSGIENLTGSSFSDELDGDEFANVLSGGGGNDYIEGRGGADFLAGDNGTDTVSYAGSAAGVQVKLEATYQAGGDAQGDYLLSFENATGSSFADSLVGDDFANVLTGGASGDELFGDWGNDRLIGGAGNDRLDGQGHADTYAYLATSDSTVALSGRDRIVFSKADGDKIDLSAIDANISTPGNEAFSFIGKASFSAPGQVRTYQAGGSTAVLANTAGNFGIQMVIELNGLVNLTASDFIL